MIVYFIWEPCDKTVKSTVDTLLMSRLLTFQISERYLGAFICFVLFLLCLLALYLTWNNHKTLQNNTKLREQIQLYKKNAEQNEVALKSAESLHKWKHDYLNHLVVMQKFIEAKEYEQLEQYVNCQRKNLSEIFPYICTGHSVIDAILMDKYAIAKSEHILYEYTIILPKQLPISNIEMTGILGNLLDNSIEACRNLKDNQDTSPYI